ncbi:MAG: hypothetical protein ACI303_02745 [Lepagella sp.]
MSTDYPDLTEPKTSARTPPMRSKKSVKSVKSVDKQKESSMLEEPLFFLLSTDFPDLTEAKTTARTPPMRSKNQ